MRRRVNKEKAGLTVRFSIRLPKEQHKWLKEQCDNAKNNNSYVSMNTIISEALKKYIER